MNAKFSAFKSHFANWREWEPNPIVIKELRQAVRSWAVTGMLMLFLTVLFLTALTFVIGQSFQVGENTRLGNSMFSVFIVILAGASAVFIPIYVGVRMAVERQENNHDLLYVSTLSPFRIVLGKFLCGAYMALLFFSACLPFMALTNLLRGVDLPTVFLILGFLFLVVCAANMVAIFLACLPVSRPFKYLFVIYGLFQSFGILSSMIGTSFIMMGSGVGAMSTSRTFWINAATVVGLIAAIIGLFFTLTVALISPPSANRARPVRVYLTAIWILGGLASFGWAARSGDAGRIMAWTIPTFVLTMIALLVTISNSDQLSQRVRRTIPRARWQRALVFPFYNGAAGGLIWLMAILAATLFVTQEVGRFFPSFSFRKGLDIHIWFVSLTAYALAYALAALFVQRNFFPRRPPKFAGLLAIMLAAGWALVPSIVLFFFNQLSWQSVEGLQLGNVFNVLAVRDESQRIYHFYCALIFLAVMLALNAKWFARQVKNFHPPAPAASENDAPALN